MIDDISLKKYIDKNLCTYKIAFVLFIIRYRQKIITCFSLQLQFTSLLTHLYLRKSRIFDNWTIQSQPCWHNSLIGIVRNKIWIGTERLDSFLHWKRGRGEEAGGHGETGVARARFQSMAPSCKSTRHSPRTCRWQ